MVVVHLHQYAIVAPEVGKVTNGHSDLYLRAKLLDLLDPAAPPPPPPPPHPRTKAHERRRERKEWRE